jgi:hypothetical protein
MRTHLLRYLLLWLAGIQLVFWCADWWKITTLVSCFVYPALLVWTFSIPAVRAQWDAAHRIARWAAVALLVLMINAQLFRRNDVTYPVVSWTMYASRRPETPQLTELDGVREDGTAFRLEIDKLVFSGMVYTELLKNYHTTTERLDSNEAGEIKRRRAVLRDRLIELGTRRITPAGESPLSRVELVVKTVARDGTIAAREILVSAELPATQGGPP